MSVLLATSFLSGLTIWTYLAGGSICSDVPPRNPSDSGRIALIDQLSIHYPDPEFVENLASSAREAGYEFDYYPPKTVTLELFVNLPSLGYSMIVLRNHGIGFSLENPAAIATSESYSPFRRVPDQLLNRITTVEVDGSRYFALMPEFITKTMCGRFRDTLVLAMGCSSASWPTLANAFIEKGALAYIGWPGNVRAVHTDIVYESLVRLLLQNNPVDQAVQSVMDTIGPDPEFGTRLSYYLA